jgi:hypothetical protein
MSSVGNGSLVGYSLRYGPSRIRCDLNVKRSHVNVKRFWRLVLLPRATVRSGTRMPTRIDERALMDIRL